MGNERSAFNLRDGGEMYSFVFSSGQNGEEFGRDE